MQVPRDSQRMEGTSWLTPLTSGFSRAILLRWLAAFPEKVVLKWHEALKEQVAGVQFVQWVKAQLVAEGRSSQPVLCLADGSYDKPEFWRGLPTGVTELVRPPKIAPYATCPPLILKGRRRSYGDRAPPAPQDYNKEHAGWKTATLVGSGAPSTVSKERFYNARWLICSSS